MLFQKNAMFRRLIIFILLVSSIIFSANASSKEQDLNLDFNRYYYNQLDNMEKAIYDNLIKSQEKFLNKEEISFAISKYNVKIGVNLHDYVYSVKRASRAYSYDNPKVNIWFDNYQCTLYASKGEIYLKCKFKETEETNTDFILPDMKEAIEEFETKCINFVSNLSGTDEEKIKQIQDWLTENSTYDQTLSAPFTRTAYGTIMEGRSVCSGFASAYKYIADLAGLNVLYVVGNFYNEQLGQYSLHAWNVAYINGKYLLIDATLDIQVDSVYDGMHYAEYNYFNYTF